MAPIRQLFVVTSSSVFLATDRLLGLFCTLDFSLLCTCGDGFCPWLESFNLFHLFCYLFLWRLFWFYTQHYSLLLFIASLSLTGASLVFFLRYFLLIPFRFSCMTGSH